MFPIKPRRPSINYGLAIANGLVGAWPIWENGTVGTGAGPSGYMSANLAAPIAPLQNNQGTPFVVGFQGPALKFSAVGSNTQIPANAAFSTVALTVAALFNTSTTGSSQTIIRQDLTNRHWLLDVTTANVLRGQVIFGGNPQITSSATVTNGNWHLGVITLTPSGSNTVLALYLDGVSQGTATATAQNPSGADIINIGSWNGGTFFAGQIDNAMIWNRSLTQAEIWQLYVDPFAPYRAQNRKWQPQIITASVPDEDLIPMTGAGTLADAVAINAAYALYRNRKIDRRTFLSLIGWNRED